MPDWDAILYTARHRKAFRAVERNLLGRNTARGWLHDLDKLFLYVFMDRTAANRIHTRFAWHHPRRARTKADYREMVVDWECARLTKPDKPLDAYDTLYALHPELEPVVLPILRDLGLAHDAADDGRG